jgi:hypothetical protein
MLQCRIRLILNNVQLEHKETHTGSSVCLSVCASIYLSVVSSLNETWLKMKLQLKCCCLKFKGGCQIFGALWTVNERANANVGKSRNIEYKFDFHSGIVSRACFCISNGECTCRENGGNINSNKL